jgi:diacylglycerol kinase (ATP)
MLGKPPHQRTFPYFQAIILLPCPVTYQQIMEFNHIYLIINPSAGQKEPVLEIIGRVFHGIEKRLHIHLLEEGEKVSDIVLEAIGHTDVIAIYGGDGSVTEAAAPLIGKSMPLAIIPGGAANVLAKGLGIPQDTETALKLLRDGQVALRTIDTGLVNNYPFLLRVNLGIMSQMVTEADPDLKDKIGQLAYGISTVKTIYESEPVNYQLLIDGQTITITGVALTVTNSGSIGIADVQLQPGIDISDGLLDVVLLKDAGFLSLVKAAGSSLLGQETDAISHWKCREVIITMPDEQTYICDDCEHVAQELVIKVVPASLSFVIPLAQ